MVCKSKLFPETTFENLPKSPIRFDPDYLAEFSELEKLSLDEMSLEYRVIYAYAREGKTLGAIATEAGIHRQKVKRAFQKVLKKWLQTQKVVTAKKT